jgi:hypothetical protein
LKAAAIGCALRVAKRLASWKAHGNFDKSSSNHLEDPIMRKLFSLAILLGLATFSSLRADVYTDAVNDIDSFASQFTHLDITSVTITNTATDLNFVIALNSSIVPPPGGNGVDWGKYMVAIDSVAGGDVSSNGWSRPISMPSGMDYWIGSWVDGGDPQRQLWKYSGGWSMTNSFGNIRSGNTVAFSVALSDLGLSLGDTFTFDVFSSGSFNDSAIDALSVGTPSVTGWGGPFASGSTLTYTVTAVPEPSSVLALSLVGLLGATCGRRRRNG